jgi:antitoxin MazE
MNVLPLYGGDVRRLNPGPRVAWTCCLLLAALRQRSLTDQAFWNNIVITMRAVHVSIRQIGNSQGVVIPKPVLAQLGLDATAGVEMTIEDGALVLRRPANPARAGWAEAARSIAEAGDDELVMGEFGNAEDSELVW